MGLDNRDYIRQSQGQNIFGAGTPMTPVVKVLIAINVVVFLAQLFSTGPKGETSIVTQWLALNLDQVLGGQVWRLVTHAFCHSTGQFFHIVFNMLCLFFFGRVMERQLGSREFLAFYMVAIMAAALAFLLLGLATPSSFTTETGQVVEIVKMGLGASGATLATLVLFGLFYPRQEILLFFVLPIQVRWVVLFIIVSDLFPALEAIRDKNAIGDGVAHTAHLGGVLFAYLYWKWKLKLAPFFGKISPVRPKSGGGNPKTRRQTKGAVLTTAGRSKAEIDKQVDELLQKISDKGFQSLSDKEKKFLEKASDKFGKR